MITCAGRRRCTARSVNGKSTRSTEKGSEVGKGSLVLENPTQLIYLSQLKGLANRLGDCHLSFGGDGGKSGVHGAWSDLGLQALINQSYCLPSLLSVG